LEFNGRQNKVSFAGIRIWRAGAVPEMTKNMTSRRVDGRSHNCGSRGIRGNTAIPAAAETGCTGLIGTTGPGRHLIRAEAAFGIAYAKPTDAFNGG